MKNIFKYRSWDLWRFSFYLFESGRWSLGITFDINGYPLLAISLIIFHIEVNFMEGFEKWKNPDLKPFSDLHLSAEEQIVLRAKMEKIFNK